MCEFKPPRKGFQTDGTVHWAISSRVQATEKKKTY